MVDEGGGEEGGTVGSGLCRNGGGRLGWWFDDGEEGDVGG